MPCLGCACARARWGGGMLLHGKTKSIDGRTPGARNGTIKRPTFDTLKADFRQGK